MFGTTISMFEPEHRSLLRRGAEAFATSIPLSESRGLREAGEFNRQRMVDIAHLGWLGLCASEDPDIGLHEMVAVHRELGRAVLPGPIVATGVLCLLIAAGAATPRAPILLDALRSGNATASLAWQGKPAIRETAHQLGVQATQEGSAWILNGHAAYVHWANKVDHLFVAARTNGGVIIACVTPASEGVIVSEAASVDRASFCDVLLDGCCVETVELVALEHEGSRLLDAALDMGRLAISAELIGMSEALFHMTLNYLKQRKQFGKALGANQALQFMAVDLFTQIELANSVLRHTCDSLDTTTDPKARARAAAGCKIRANDVALMMAKQAIQLHGAIGYTDECDVSLFVKRAFTSAAWLGTSSLLRAQLAELHPLAAEL